MDLHGTHLHFWGCGTATRGRGEDAPATLHPVWSLRSIGRGGGVKVVQRGARDALRLRDERARTTMLAWRSPRRDTRLPKTRSASRTRSPDAVPSTSLWTSGSSGT